MRRIALIGVAIGLGLSVIPATAQEPAPNEERVVEPSRAVKPAEQAPPTKGPTASVAAEAAAARVVAIERLRALGKPPEKGQERDKAAEARIAAMKAVYKAREVLLVEWEKTLKARAAIEHPDPSPEAEVAEQKVALERTKGTITRATTDKITLLPDLFRRASRASKSC